MENNQEREIPTISLCFYRSSCCLLPNQAVQFRIRKITTLCLKAPLWAFDYFVFTYDFSSGDCEGENEHIISCFFLKNNKHVSVELIGKSI